MKAPLTMLGLIAGAAAFAQFNDRPPLFPTPPVVGVPPMPLTNVGRTNLFTGTNAFFTNEVARFTNGLRTNSPFIGRPPGLTNFGQGGFTNGVPGAVVPEAPAVPPALPTVPGTPTTTPGVPPALPGNTPGLPGNTPGLPGRPEGLPGNAPALGAPGGVVAPLPPTVPPAPNAGIVPRSTVPTVPGTPGLPPAPVPRKVPQAPTR